MLIIASVNSMGCARLMLDHAPHVYQPFSAPGKSFGPLSLGIAPVADQRPVAGVKERAKSLGAILLCDFFAPIIPFGDNKLSRPDEKEDAGIGYKWEKGLDFIIWEDLMKEFQQTRVVDRVVPLVGSEKRTDLVLKPTLYNSLYVSRAICYLPIYGFFIVPALGPPQYIDTIYLGIRLELYGQDLQNPLWTFTIFEHSAGYYNPFYYLTGIEKDLTKERFPQVWHDLLANGLKKAIPELRSFLSSQTEAFWRGLGHPEMAVGKPHEAPAGGVEDIIEQILKGK